jgi:chondroitin sulfate N-acetylgalactosaminyltransferase 1/2
VNLNTSSAAEVANDVANILNSDNLLKVGETGGGSPTNSNRQIITPTNKKTINFILPMSDNLMLKKYVRSIKVFLDLFERVAINQDSMNGGMSGVKGQFVTLTIVFSYKNLTLKRKFEKLLSDFKHRTKFMNLKLILIGHTAFSRAKLLQIGIENLNVKSSNENLIFLCDVDIVFNQMFLDLCRFNTVKNKRVFFPVLYSFYNEKFPDTRKQVSEDLNRLDLIIDNKDTGYWRDSGFGMACMYKEDFDSIGGFGQFYQQHGGGWGGEDLYLYRRFLRTDLEIFRSITPGLFHLHHPKVCDKTLLDHVQYRNCMNVKIFSETSHRKFGLAFFNETSKRSSLK